MQCTFAGRRIYLVQKLMQEVRCKQCLSMVTLFPGVLLNELLLNQGP